MNASTLNGTFLDRPTCSVHPVRSNRPALPISRGKELLQDLRSLLHRATFMVVLLTSATVFAQTSSERAAVQLSATVQASPARITINWTSMASTSSITIYRKTLAANTWGSALATVSSTATQYQDNSVTVGTAYEYRVLRVAGGVSGNGYIATGIEVSPIDHRGKMILLVDNTVASSLSSEIQQLERDLRADGWSVVRTLCTLSFSFQSRFTGCGCFFVLTI